MRLVIDITTSARWKGHDVGITRVERKYAQYLLEHVWAGDCPPLFVRQIQPGKFTELSPVDAARELAPFTETKPALSPVHKTNNRVDRALRAGKRLGEGAFSRTQHTLPEDAQADFRAVAVHSQRTAKHLLHAIRHRGLSESADNGATNGQPIGWSGIDSDDVYVSLGLDWDDKSILKLRQLKRTHGFRSVHMVYDLIPTQFPQWLPSQPDIYDCYFTDLMWTADRLVCISETTQRAVTNFATQNDLPCPPSEVVKLGADLKRATQKVINELDGEEFVLFVSTIEPRKNHRFLLELWTRLAAMGPVPKLVFVGRAGWNCEEVLAAIRWLPEHQSHIVQLANVNDDELSWLYANCLFTVYPSHYEGWGLPVVESLLSGKLCIASTAGAVVEAGHNLAIHLDTFDGPIWVETIHRLLSDRTQLSQAQDRISAALPGLQQAASWDAFGSHMTAAIQRTGTSQ
jgi:glycosyltransferase involved in cell wall biosynthesis